MTQPQPPGQPVPPSDGRWPAWLVDAAIVAAGAAALSAALAAAVGAPLALAAAFWAWAGSMRRPAVPLPDGGTAAAMEEPTPDVRGWLVREFDADERVADALLPVVEDIVAEGALVGSRSARAQLDAVEESMGEVDPGDPALTLTADWDGWEPGNPDAARQVLSDDGNVATLTILLRDTGITIKSVAQHRVDEIAAVLSEALERGSSVEQTAEALRGILDDARWAEVTAWTELNRATSAATLAEYRESGMGAKEWMTAFDQRVCPRCGANEDAGPVPLDERFPSGDLHPPGHPRCRCALLPVIAGFELDESDLAKAARGDGADLKHYWTRGEGRAKWINSAHPWTALYRHLRKHMSDGKAKRTAARWFKAATGMWPGERKGRNPHGRG